MKKTILLIITIIFLIANLLSLDFDNLLNFQKNNKPIVGIIASLYVSIYFFIKKNIKRREFLFYLFILILFGFISNYDAIEDSIETLF